MSGGGKSTLADLIPRFYDVPQGRITIDGVDIRDVHPGQPARADRASSRSTPSCSTTRCATTSPTATSPSRHGRDHRRRPRRQRARVHHGAAAGLRHRHRRARRQAVGRPAPAPRDRARAAEGRADPGARRGDLGARQRVGAPGAERARHADAEPHDAGHRAPAVDDPARRPHRRDGARPRSSSRARTTSCWRSTPSTASSTTCSSRTSRPPSRRCCTSVPARKSAERRHGSDSSAFGSGSSRT